MYSLIVDLQLAGKLVIIVGGGTEGTRKVKSILGQNCKIVVVSNRLNKFLLDLVEEGKIDIIKTTLKDTTILDRFEKPFLILVVGHPQKDTKVPNIKRKLLRTILTEF